MSTPTATDLERVPHVARGNCLQRMSSAMSEIVPIAVEAPADAPVRAYSMRLARRRAFRVVEMCPAAKLKATATAAASSRFNTREARQANPAAKKSATARSTTWIDVRDLLCLCANHTMAATSAAVQSGVFAPRGELRSRRSASAPKTAPADRTPSATADCSLGSKVEGELSSSAEAILIVLRGGFATTLSHRHWPSRRLWMAFPFRRNARRLHTYFLCDPPLRECWMMFPSTPDSVPRGSTAICTLEASSRFTRNDA